MPRRKRFCKQEVDWDPLSECRTVDTVSHSLLLRPPDYVGQFIRPLQLKQAGSLLLKHFIHDLTTLDPGKVLLLLIRFPREFSAFKPTQIKQMSKPLTSRLSVLTSCGLLDIITSQSRPCCEERRREEGLMCKMEAENRLFVLCACDRLPRPKNFFWNNFDHKRDSEMWEVSRNTRQDRWSAWWKKMFSECSSNNELFLHPLFNHPTPSPHQTSDYFLHTFACGQDNSISGCWLYRLSSSNNK